MIPAAIFHAIFDDYFFFFLTTEIAPGRTIRRGQRRAMHVRGGWVIDLHGETDDSI